MAKKYYSYHPQTFEYLGEFDAPLDPLETKTQGKEVYLLPAHATFTAPTLTPGENEVLVYNPQSNDWEIKSDYRGTVIYEIDENGYFTGNASTIENIGEEINNRPTQPPSTELVKPKWDGTQWIEEEDISKYKRNKIQEIKNIAYRILSETDWKVIRHRDQSVMESGIIPSLSPEEYQNLLQYRQSVRDWSNQKENEANNASTIEEVKNISLEDYPQLNENGI